MKQEKFRLGLRFRLGINDKFCTEKVFQPWHRLPGAVLESPPLEVFRKGVDVAPGDRVSGGGMVGLGDLRELFQP